MTFKRFLLGHSSLDALALASLPKADVEWQLDIDPVAFAAVMKPHTANDQ